MGGYRSSKWRGAMAVMAVLAAFVVSASPAQADETASVVPLTKDSASAASIERQAEPVPGQYIVTLKDPAAAEVEVYAEAAALADEYGGTVLHTYTEALTGFNVRMSDADADALRKDPAVALVVQDEYVHSEGSQSPAPWGLDRIDQRDRPVNNAFSYQSDGSVTTVYVIDSGIRSTHVDFEGRAYFGTDVVGDGRNGQDCYGHGTHVASTIGGAQYGVAKNVALVNVRVLGCQGTGTVGQVLAGIDWVTVHHESPSVANMSIGGPGNSLVDFAVVNSIASGVSYVVAAGNDNANACGYSPARTLGTITVGATNATDTRAPFSNFGGCVDLFAPGVDIVAAGIASDTATATRQGSSMASPHVAGAAAMYLNSNPGATPAQVRAAIIGNATTGRVTNPGSGSPNTLEYVGFIGSRTAGPSSSVSRIFGLDAIDTSLAISRAMFGAGAAQAVVLARSDYFADALAGGPLAAMKTAPLMITPGAGVSADLDPRVLSEIRRVLPTGRTVYVLGGNLALSPNIDASLQAAGYIVVRVSGVNQYATAVAIAIQLGSPSVVFLATGLHFADALSAVPAAIQARGAILLTIGNLQAPETAAYLAAHPPSKRYAIGGPLAAAGADPAAIPVYGQDLFSTSAVVANTFFRNATTTGAATGLNFPDALSGGVFMGGAGHVGPMVLVMPSSPIPPSIANYLSRTTETSVNYLFGGPLAVGEDVAFDLGHI